MSKSGVLKYVVPTAFGSIIFVATQLFVGVQSVDGAEDSPPGTIRFTGSTKLSKAHGVFETWRVVKAEIDATNPQKSVVELEVDVASLNTKSKMRDKHLREEDFFFVEENPTASVRVYDFQLDSEDKENSTHYTATMDITVRGVKKTMPIAFEVTKESPFTVHGTCELDRTDFGVGKKYNSWNPMSVKTKIVIEFSATIPDPAEEDK